MRKIFRPWKLWSDNARIAALAALFIFGIVASGVMAVIRHDSVPPSIAAAVGACSLFLAAFSASGAVGRQARKDTLEAYVKWSDATFKTRSEVTALLGAKTITDEQATGLNEGTAFLGKDGKELSADEQKKLRHDVCELLNGLERLAAGVLLGIYDLEVLRILGGTIIARTFERFEPYIKASRAKTFRDRQNRAYVQLELVHSMLEKRHIVAKLNHEQDEIDQERLSRLRRG